MKKIYNIGDYIIYGKRGICVVKDIGYPELMSVHELLSIDNAQLYYTLVPVYTTETIYTPVDTSIFMRAAINYDEAINLIQQIPTIENTMDTALDISTKELPFFYNSLIDTHDCKDLVRLIIMVYAKTQKAVQEKKKLGQIDQNFMRDAEDILYGELSIALGISKERVPVFIEEMIKTQDCGNLIHKHDFRNDFVSEADHT